MTVNITLAATAVVAVCAYYTFAWLLSGRVPKSGVLIPSYEPPRGLSPAMLRYVWKEQFDDRTFWAGVMSLAAKGLATIHAENGVTHFGPTEAANRKQSLPDEEEILLARLLRGRPKRGMLISMLDPRTAPAASDMAVSLHRRAVGRWFEENRVFAGIGIGLSIAAIFALAQPRRIEQWGVIVFAIAMMAPAAFYLFFLAIRTRDVCRSLREQIDRTLVWRAAGLLAFMISCSAAIVLGAVVLGGDFGWPLLAITAFLTILNVFQLQWMKAPTQDGEKLITEIEGFRLFLKTVEQLPMQRSDAPGEKAGCTKNICLMPWPSRWSKPGAINFLPWPPRSIRTPALRGRSRSIWECGTANRSRSCINPNHRKAEHSDRRSAAQHAVSDLVRIDLTLPGGAPLPRCVWTSLQCRANARRNLSS